MAKKPIKNCHSNLWIEISNQIYLNKSIIKLIYLRKRLVVYSYKRKPINPFKQKQQLKKTNIIHSNTLKSLYE